MTLLVRFRREAEAELTEAVEWYEARARGLGAEFLRAVEASVAAIQRNPTRNPLVLGAARRAALRRFPYSLVYLPSDGQILIVACVHTRRDPQRWRGRL